MAGPGGGGAYDPVEDRCAYFLASDTSRLTDAAHLYRYLLVPVNNVMTPKHEALMVEWMDKGCKVLLDSGVFDLASKHAAKHAPMTFYQALGLHPAELDGYDRLMDRYHYLASTYGDRLWGYAEVDQGGTDVKVETRATLEAAGLDPLPVYHPLQDPPAYLDRLLAEGYTRLMVGNVVQSDAPTRRAILAMLWEKQRGYPDVWFHLLGLTPSPVTHAYPFHSADSSSWMNAIRWPGGPVEYTDLARAGTLSDQFQHRLGSDRHDDDGPAAAVAMSSRIYEAFVLNWRHHHHRVTELGLDMVPPLTLEEQVL